MSLVENIETSLVEENLFFNSVVEVATSVPAFVGYTEIAFNGSRSLQNKPWKINSMTEYRSCFGGPPSPEFEIQECIETTEIFIDEKNYNVKRKDKYILYYSMLLFFANGGGPCYIVSVGDYTQDMDGSKLEGGIITLAQEMEPTILVIPEAIVLANKEDCYSLQKSMLKHCGSKCNRIALLDIYDGFKERKDPKKDVVDNFRKNIGCDFLDYGVSYYPWLNTTLIQETELDYENLNVEQLRATLYKELNNHKFPEEKRVQVIACIDSLKPGLTDVERNILHKKLLRLSPLYGKLIKSIHHSLNLLPPSAALGGVITVVDNSKGVWKAPVDINLSMVDCPSIHVSLEEQEDLTVPFCGRSVNAIRVSSGDSVRVWSAKTLDGNSLDWQYMNFRRTKIMLEESMKSAIRTYIFDANTPRTWKSIKCMITNFLNNIWRRGGLVGFSPDEAYSVHVGLEETMTADEVLAGVLRVKVLAAIIRPSEFIEINIRQQLQKVY